MKPKRLLIAFSLLLAVPLALAAAEKQLRLSIVDRSIDFHGGAVYENSEIELTIASKSGSWKVLANHASTGQWSYEASREQNGVRSVYRHTSETVEHLVDGVPRRLSADDRESVIRTVAARVYFSFLPLRLNDGNTYKEDQGLERWGDRELHRVKVSFRPDTSSNDEDQYVFWFDPETARLEQFGYSFSGGLRFRPLTNHRQVGGVMFYDQPNYAIDDSGLRVDQLTPEFVEGEMRLLSTVKFQDIQVRPLDPPLGSPLGSPLD